MPARKTAKSKPAPAASLKVRIRILCGEDNAFGPGKADLLDHLAQSPNLAQAAQRMNMSYNKAWLLVQAMNRNFAEPLVLLTRGGSDGGKATLTEAGRRALQIYRQMNEASIAAAQRGWKKMQRLLKTSERQPARFR